MNSNELDATDKELLGLIQSGFPICSRPYAALGESLGLTENECLERVRDLKRRGIVRRIGANFSSAGLGYVSTLCAASVPDERLDEFVGEVNAIAGVTHNYLRRHRYNVWFTCIGPSRENIQRELDAITANTGVAILNLPAARVFKIRVDFPMDAPGSDREPT